MRDVKRIPVGGMVRDMFLGQKPQDRDWLVLGETEDSMILKGWKRVGKSSTCPVFIHAADKLLEEHALPRTEVSTGGGYNDFIWTTENVTIEQDLARRDFTMNSMAYDRETQEYIDPMDGREDIRNKVIRHNSDSAFIEDPLRVIRGCRFAARFEFDLAPETQKIMEDMVWNGMLNNLPGERIYAELIKVFKTTKRPSLFFRHLASVGALRLLFPELYAMIGVEQPAEHHQEGDVFEHTMMCLDKCHDVSTEVPHFFAVLFHDIGKIRTPKHEWPAHHGHDSADNLYLINRIAERLKMDSHTKKCCELAVKFHMKYHRVEELSAGSIVKMFRELKVKHLNSRKATFYAFITVGLCDEIGRLPGKPKSEAVDYHFNWIFLANQFNHHKVELRTDKVFEGKAIRNMAMQQEVMCVKRIFRAMPIRKECVDEG